MTLGFVPLLLSKSGVYSKYGGNQEGNRRKQKIRDNFYKEGKR